MSNEVPRTPLDEAVINSLITPYWRVSVVEFTGSTQNDLAQLISSGIAFDGQVLTTEYQTSGRGRLDRTFEAPKSSALLFSFYIKPRRKKEEWGFIPLIAGLSVVSAISKLDSSIQLDLKWPNDCLVNEKKCAGVIAQALADGIIIGIGLNVSMRQDELPVPNATSLALEGSKLSDRNQILAQILISFSELLQEWETGISLVDRYEKASTTIGKQVRVELPGGQILEGMATGISHIGELILDNGIHVSAGDVIHLR